VKNTLLKSLAAALALFAAATADAEPIRLQAATLVPEAPGTARAARPASSLPERGVYLIQHEGRIPSGWRRQIAEHGGTVYGYIPENAYLVGIAAADYAALAEEVEHSYLGEFRPEWKYDAAAVERKLAGDAVFSVLLFEASERGPAAAAVRASAGCEVLAEGGDSLRARLTREGIEVLSRLWAVHWIEPYDPPTVANNVAVDENLMNVRPLWPGSDTGLGLTGKGQIVGVCDTGFDTGDLATVHEDVRGRIVAAFDVAGDGDWGDPNGHGTHVVGSVLGDGTMSGGDIKGVAYEAKLVIQGGATNSAGKIRVPSDLTELFGQTYTNGARIHSDSWGVGKKGETDVNAQYSASSRDFDKFMFEHPDMLIVNAAGNNGIDADPTDGVIDTGFSLVQEATSKNAMVVGASETYRTEGRYAMRMDWSGWTFEQNGTTNECYPVSPINNDFITRPHDGVHQGMAAFSSRGPCRDGRTKPDIVAPGTGILSLLPQGEELAPKPSSSLYHDSHYCYKQGTSMATPLVAGAAALVRQWLAEEWDIANPDGATLKALLLAGAKSLSPGQYGTDKYREIPAAYPNNVEGWGQANLRNTVEPRGGMLIIDGEVIANGETKRWFVGGKPGIPLTIVMAYTDAPGDPAADQEAAKLVNDLDLTVLTPSRNTLRPNSLGSGRDSLNNVEGVRIAAEDVEEGLYEIQIRAWSVPEGMDTSLTWGTEDASRYSLVALGGWSPRTGGKGRIYFDGNGGTASEASRDVYLGQPLGGSAQSLPTAETRAAGLAFAGWWTEPEGGHRVTVDTVVSMLAVKYYAHWKTANDARADAIELQGESGSAEGDTALATRDETDPLAENLSADATNTVWYVWTAPKSGAVRFSTEGSSIHAVVGIAESAGLAWVGGDMGGTGKGTAGVTFRARENTSYYIEIAGRDGERGPVKLNWAMFDDLDITFDGNGGTIAESESGTGRPGVSSIARKLEWGDTLGGTGPLPFPWQASSLPGDWPNYAGDGWWTAPAGGVQVSADTVPDCNTTYYMHWKPKNDHPADAFAISGTEGTATEISTRNATLAADDPMQEYHGSFTNTVWYKFSPPASGRYCFDASASTAPDGGAMVPLVAAYTLTDDWERVAHDRGSLTMTATAGTTYYIGVGGYVSLAPYGTVRLSWSHPIWLELSASGGSFPSGGGMRSVPITADVPIGEEALSEIPALDDYAFDGWWTQEEGGEPVTAESAFTAFHNWVYAHWRPRPANNKPMSSSTELETGDGIYAGSVSVPNADAGSEGDDPLVQGHDAERTLWWTFRPVYQGIVRFDTVGSTQPDGKDLDTVLGVYSWTYEDGTFVYTEVAFNDDMLVEYDVEYPVTRDVSAASVAVGSELLKVGAGVYPGKPAGELVLNWTYEKLLVTLDPAGGRVPDDETGVYLPANEPLGRALYDIPTPYREGYLFTGWSAYSDRPNVTEATVIPENWTLVAHWAPRNDNFGDAQILNPPYCFGDFWSVSNKDATVQAGEPMEGIENVGRTLWYRWTPPSDGIAVFTTSNSVTDAGIWLDTLLGVYTGDSLANLSEVAFSDDATIGWADTPASLVEFEAAGGTPYLICVGTRESGAGTFEGTVLLSWSLSHRIVFDANGGTLAGGGETLEVAAKHGESIDAPSVSRPGWTFLGWVSDGGETFGTSWSAESNCVWRAQWEEGLGNDNFAGARAISGSSGTLVQSNAEATTEEGEPLVANSRYGTPRSLWWTWTAPASGIAVFTTDGSTYLGSDPDTGAERREEYPTMLGIYTGDALGSLVTVALDYRPKYDEEGPARYTSSNRFEVAKGTVYRIAAAGASDRKNLYPESTIVLNWSYESMEGGTSIAPLDPSASAAEVEAAVAAAGFADPGVARAIGGSVEKWNDFAGWANGTIGDADTVVASPHAAASWLLGTSALLENAPAVAIDGAAVVSVEGGKAMTLSVTVKDGGTPVEVSAAKVASLVEATTDPADWETPEKRLDPHAEPLTPGSAPTVNLRVTPSAGSAPRAFLRIAQ
jgi:uncharacterized repeat protein (TIGR02543 family)